MSMFMAFFYLFFVLGILFLVFVIPIKFSIALLKLSSDDYIPKSNIVICCIPIVNIFYSWKKYSDNIFCFAGICDVLLLISIISRFISMFFFYENTTIQTLTVIFMLVSFVLTWISNAKHIWNILSDAGIYSTFSKFLYSVTIMFGQIEIGFFMIKKLQHYLKSRKQSLYITE